MDFWTGALKIKRALGGIKIHMSTEFSALNRARVTLENADELSASDLSELCDATEEAIKSGGGFGWLNAPPRNILEDYWRGVLLIPERS